jgi:hypothetical protein
MKILDKEKLIEEVRDKGVEINNIDELKKINSKYKDLISILLKYLIEVEDEGDKEFLVRCLGVKGFTEASKTLIDEFYKSNNSSLKWAIGNTLSIILDNTIVPEMVQIVKEKEHGTARQMIVDGLGNFKEQYVELALIELLNDDQVVGHAISALGKIGDKSVIEKIEPFKNHKVNWIRKEAERAIKRLSK